MRRFFTTIAVALVLVPTAGHAQGNAQSSSAASEVPAPSGSSSSSKSNAVRLGIIASTGNFGRQPIAIDGDTSGGVPGDAASDISASVSYRDKETCAVSLINSSKDTGYSLRYAVNGYTQQGEKDLSKKFSVNLPPGKSESKTFNCPPKLNLSVDLLSASPK